MQQHFLRKRSRDHPEPGPAGREIADRQMTQNHPKNRITVGCCRSPQAAFDASITVIHGDSQTPPGAVMIVTIGQSGLNMLYVLEKAFIC